jgi:hypothetical protein
LGRHQSGDRELSFVLPKHPREQQEGLPAASSGIPANAVPAVRPVDPVRNHRPEFAAMQFSVAPGEGFRLPRRVPVFAVSPETDNTTTRYCWFSANLPNGQSLRIRSISPHHQNTAELMQYIRTGVSSLEQALRKAQRLSRSFASRTRSPAPLQPEYGPPPVRPLPSGPTRCTASVRGRRRSPARPARR